MLRKRKFDPSRDELEKLVWEMPTTQVGALFGVSDKAIDKRCKSLGIAKPGRGYWTIFKIAKAKAEVAEIRQAFTHSQFNQRSPPEIAALP